MGRVEAEGTTLDELGATQLAKLVPVSQPVDTDIPDNYGCGFLPDGRLVTTDIGNKAAGDPNGQLIVWFPPFGFDDNPYCAVDVTMATAQQVLVTETDVLVVEARGPGVSRYSIDALPTSATECAPVEGEPFIAADDVNRLGAPNGIATGPDGELYVFSVLAGIISEFTADGTFVRIVLEPPPGESLGPVPLSTGTPLGLAVSDDGTIYFADLGLVVDGGVGPGDGTGSVRRIMSAPTSSTGPPEVLESGLQFPDGVGLR